MPTYPLKKLGEICDILDNKRKPVTQSDRISGPYPYYGATGILDYVDKYIFDEKLILIGEDGAKWGSGENTAFSVDGKYWVNNHAHVIRPHRKIVMDEWIIYFLNITNLLEHVTGVTVPKLNQAKLREIEIPLPPLSVQEEIVAKLDAALASIEEAKAKTEQALAATRELWESTLEEAFRGGDGWHNKKLEDVCDRIMDGTHFSPKNSTTGERLYVSAKNIKLHGVDFTKATYISEEDHKIIYKRCPVKKGDVLYIKDGATTGIATINNLDEEFSLLSSVAVFQVTKKLLLEQFLVYYLNSGFGKKHMLGMIDGTAITRLTLTKLNSGIIPLAPLSEQSLIVTHLDAVRAETDRLAALYEQKLADLDELRRSVLQEAFA